jgi:hypothetical protein
LVIQQLSPFNRFEGYVQSYTWATGTLFISGISNTVGTFTSNQFYNVNINGIGGPTGPSGITGPVGPTGISGDKYTSTTNTTIIFGTPTYSSTYSFNVAPGLSYLTGNNVLISQQSNPFGFFSGTVLSYNASSGLMSVNNINNIQGTFTSPYIYNINLNGIPGPTGWTGPTAPTGTTGGTGPTGPQGNIYLSQTTSPQTLGNINYLGTASLVVGTNLAYAYGTYVLVMSSTSPYSYFVGQVSSYTASNGLLNLFNIQNINGTFSASSNYTVNLTGSVGIQGAAGAPGNVGSTGPTGLDAIGAPGDVGSTGPTGPLAINKVLVQITYSVGSVLPVSFTVSPSNFVSYVTVNGAGLIMNGVTRGPPDYVVVNSKQVKANFGGLPPSSYVTTNMEPLSSVFQVAYDSSASQLILYDASSTSFRIASGDIVSLPAPQVILTLIYFA